MVPRNPKNPRAVATASSMSARRSDSKAKVAEESPSLAIVQKARVEKVGKGDDHDFFCIFSHVVSNTYHLVSVSTKLIHQATAYTENCPLQKGIKYNSIVCDMNPSPPV
jgi:hypothetical protein